MASSRGKGAQADRSVRAAESGARIAHNRQNIRERQNDRAENARQFNASNEQRTLDRSQRQWEQTRKDRAERDKVRAKNQAGKPRTSNFGNEGYDPGTERRPTGDERLDENARQFDSRQTQQVEEFQQSQQQQSQQFETKTDLTAATHGLERAGGGGDNPRLQALQQEMANRQREQMGLPTEQKGKRGFVPTEAAEQKSAQDAGMTEREMRTKELNARANMQRAVTSHARLGSEIKGAKTSAARKELQAKRKAVEETLMQPIKSDAGRLDRFMKGDQTQADMQTLKAMVNNPHTGVPPVGLGRALHDEINSGEIGPRVTQFLNAKIAASAIEFAYATGKLPDGDLVDFSSEGMQEFSRRAVEARQLLQPNTVAGQMFNNDQQFNKEQVNKIKRGYPDHIEMVNKLAALLVLKQQASAPSPATTGEQEPKYEQRRADPTQPATPAERAGQVTPAEAGRQAEAAGGTAAPATGKKPYKPRQGQYEGLPGLPGSLGGYQ